MFGFSKLLLAQTSAIGLIQNCSIENEYKVEACVEKVL